MEVVALIQIAGFGIAAGFAALGYGIGVKRGTRPEDATRPSQTDTASVASLATKYQQEVAELRTKLRASDEKVRALRELQDRAAPEGDKGEEAVGQTTTRKVDLDSDQVRILQDALTRRDRQIETLQRKTNELDEKNKALTELVAGKSGATVGESVDQITSMQSAIQSLERELAKARRDAQAARENVHALKELAATGAGRNPVSAQSRDFTKLSQAVDHLQFELAKAKRRASEAEDKYRALKEVVAQTTQVARRDSSSVSRVDEISLLQQALERMDGELRAARREADEAKDRLRAMGELTQQT